LNNYNINLLGEVISRRRRKGFVWEELVNIPHLIMVFTYILNREIIDADAGAVHTLILCDEAKRAYKDFLIDRALITYSNHLF